MQKQIKKYLEILRIELQDLEEDFKIFAEMIKRKVDEGEITNFVYQENSALLFREISLIQRAIKDLDHFKADGYEDLDQFTQDLEDFFRKELSEITFPKAVQLFLSKKIKKVKEYMDIQ